MEEFRSFDKGKKKKRKDFGLPTKWIDGKASLFWGAYRRANNFPIQLTRHFTHLHDGHFEQDQLYFARLVSSPFFGNQIAFIVFSVWESARKVGEEKVGSERVLAPPF